MNEEKTEKTEKKIFKKFKFNKTFELVLLAVLGVALLLILYNTFFSKNSSSDNSASVSLTYNEKLETRLKTTLTKIDGVGSVDVFISCAQSGENVYLYSEVVGKDGTVTKNPVLKNGEYVVDYQKDPQIYGVIIIAEGAKSLAVRLDLLEATASALNIDKKIIQIYEMMDN